MAMARIRTVFADKGYDAEHHRDLCRAFGAKPGIHKRGQPRGSGLGKQRWPVERSNAWVLENRRLGLRYDRLGFIIQSLLQAACRPPVYSWLHAGSPANSENRLLGAS